MHRLFIRPSKKFHVAYPDYTVLKYQIWAFCCYYYFFFNYADKRHTQRPVAKSYHLIQVTTKRANPQERQLQKLDPKTIVSPPFRDKRKYKRKLRTETKIN